MRIRFDMVGLREVIQLPLSDGFQETLRFVISFPFLTRQVQ